MAGLYVHIPFCKTRCAYCDFYSQVSREGMKKYVSLLLREAQMRLIELRGEPIETIYIGGGTPSQLCVDDIITFIQGLGDMSLTDDAVEFTLEVNPDDVSVDYLSALRNMGVNRVSMGVQSFIDTELNYIGRRHTARQAVDAVYAIREAGFDNFSIDLIYGLPLQSVASWKESVDMAVRLDVPHLSAYCLSYEQGTRLWSMRERGVVKETAEEDLIEMYKLLVDLLHENGYEHYEISNFAKPGRRSRHNSSYWNNVPYLGLGASAHSYDGQQRRYNVADLHEYMKRIEDGRLACEVEDLEWWERYDEYVMVRLRTKEGLDLDDAVEKFGERVINHIEQSVQPFLDKGLMRKNENKYALTAGGVLLSDGIIRDLMWNV